MRPQRKEAGAFTKFRLLIWKNLIQQWRHRLQTVVELLLPVITMTLILILRWQVEPTNRETIRYPEISSHSLQYSSMIIAGLNTTRMSIAYSPTSPELEDVVRSSVANLLLLNIKHIINDTETIMPEVELPPDINWNDSAIYEIIKRILRVDAYDNSNALRGIYALEEITREVVLAVEFNDSLFGATELSNNLSFALRFPERPRLNSFYAQGGRSWRTDDVFPVFENPGPRFPLSWEGGNDPGYVNEMFIAFQSCISAELVSRLTGKPELKSFAVNIQRYPHPPYVDDLAVEALQMIFPMFILLSFSYSAVNLVRAVTLEKELQLKETMKIMGISTWLHWTAWFFKQFIYLMISAILIVVLLKVSWFTNADGFSGYAVFTNTPWTVLLFFLALYLICSIFFCFMISGFFSKGSTSALFGGVIWVLVYIPALVLSMDNNMSIVTQVITCLSLNCAMSYGFQLLFGKESIGGMQWGDFMASPSSDSSRFVFGHVILMLVFDSVLYMLIALYLEQVLPGPFGLPKPWYFPIQKSFWFPNNEESKNGIIIEHAISNDDVILEKDPENLTVGVRMNNLTKIFGANVAVNQVTLNIFDNQITVLLGHNGAGKSTTMSMLTGNMKATRGSVTLAGYDIQTQVKAARAHLGFCPQHNVLFNDLTVKEHLEFFARLKGFSGKELNQEIDSLIEKLELQEKRNYVANGLSGGQKRRLCVGIALSGAASVVLLDEPTSGMDPASRRALWDLLQREKRGRSIILTTHFMDEADVLGDRVAIMANGRLQCVGTPYFLKRHYGVGYTLVVVKKEGFDYTACTDLINKYIPGIAIKEDRGPEINYSLTNIQSHAFEDMLNDFEKNVNNIKFKDYGLIATTLEDVFMSVGSDVATINSVSDDGAASLDLSGDDNLKNEFSSLEQLTKEGKVSGASLIGKHVLAVWMKLFLVWFRSWWMVLLQLAVPIVMMNATLLIVQFLISFVANIQIRHLSLEYGYSRTETLLSFNGSSSSSIGALASNAYENIFKSSGIDTMEITIVEDQSIDEYYLERASDPIEMGALRHSVLTGATFSDDFATAWFSNFAYHDVATSLASVYSALLRAFNSTAEINVYNHPIEATYKNQNDMQLLVTMISMQLSSGVASCIAIVSAVFVMFYIKERACGAKLLQKAAGIQPVVLWGSAAVFDWLLFSIICITIVITCAAFEVQGLSTFVELGRMYLCLIVYGAAMLPLNYLLSHLFEGPALGFVVIFFTNCLLGMMGPQIVEALSSPQLNTQNVADILDTIFQFFPLYSLVTCVRELNQIGLVEYSCMRGCEYISVLLPDLKECTMAVMCEHYLKSCCVRESPYFEWEKPGVLRYLVVMLATCGVLWLILMTIEYRLFQKVFMFRKIPPPIPENTLDKDVADEAEHVRQISKPDLARHGLVAKNLSKYYGSNLAVDQVSFTVSDSECFGLLGVNGAGKTTTFKMLMGDENISSGEAFVSGYSVQQRLTKVHENIGYCPQFDALFGELTGRETLRLFSLLRGLRNFSGAHADLLAHSLGFLKHLDKRVDQYSGGTKRKLNTAIAFLGTTRLIFVDEPTTGVDPAAKRHVWRAMRGVQRTGRGVVLTSHSMEECEALCSRLTIMVNGRFQCLGSPQHLKNKFSQGFTLIIKLKSNEETDPSSSRNQEEAIKNYVTANFVNPKMMEEHQGLITYYLPDQTVPWSKMFGIMERAKQSLDVEDYSISQTTLEQIFLQFTKYQREGL